ncbi:MULTISPECIES: type I-F CRISPR-associated protein Csy2 [unclassified Halomonas]|uniref:type I-F CRISPR-associated protein Csy2 n=1 Tax=unclassified Halomonas TaxID=2609666 RepID=UPI002886AEA0|nr:MULTISPECIES: type I-F CRISPR-associated protein Csy2 [unclassified Halomonas]MDT0499970.1 type I-F CRISPR-associated protein Csy2 [Halomonas sp. PAR7]MDT0512374.1 type I-F CRISPR-associated protein Csy2 [Halomonas sp. LES1]MDT0591008.1 type I-F CRISPR-associated protein Csy2 [Halomonas sp. PAR8]
MGNADPKALLVLPHLRIQNANAISSPLTWGFPAMSAFVGFMHALERRLPESLDLQFNAMGVICHDYETQTQPGYVKSFHLTRNPVGKDGKTAAIVEEGRMHLDVSLVLGVDGKSINDVDAAQAVMDIVASMRIAGGSVMPPLPGKRRYQPELKVLGDDPGDRQKTFHRLKRRWLPGFALVLRDDLLQEHHQERQQAQPDTTLLDSWLDLSRLNWECHQTITEDENDKETNEVEWRVRKKPGWLVPLPVGYGALTDVFEAGEVASARDDSTPFCFVESLYSIGQWRSPHHLQSPRDLLWYVDNNLEQGLYRLNNDYQAH